MCNVYLTEHAYDRMKERVGVSRKAADRIGFKAYTDGISKEVVSGRLYRYIASEAKCHNRRNMDIRIYGEMVYCFVIEENKAILLTVFWVPGDLKKQALCVQRRKAA